MNMVFHYWSWSGRSIVMAWVMRLMVRFGRQMIFYDNWWKWRGSYWCHKFMFLMMMVRWWGSIMLFNMVGLMVMWWSIMFFRMVMNFMMYRVMVNWMVRNFMVMNRVMRVLMWVMQRFHNNFIRGVIKN